MQRAKEKTSGSITSKETIPAGSGRREEAIRVKSIEDSIGKRQINIVTSNCNRDQGGRSTPILSNSDTILSMHRPTKLVETKNIIGLTHHSMDTSAIMDNIRRTRRSGRLIRRGGKRSRNTETTRRTLIKDNIIGKEYLP